MMGRPTRQRGEPTHMKMRMITGRSLIGGIAVLTAVIPLEASASTTRGYSEWTLNGSGTTWSGAVISPGPIGMPTAIYTTNSTGPSTPGGTTMWLGQSTPPGVLFGSSQSRNYLSAATTTSRAPSTTSIYFPTPTPTQFSSSGWGFVLGDIDADEIRVTATRPGGSAASVDELGWQGAFNFCGVTPKPSGCPSGSSTDVPSWNASTSTLRGNGADTGGASGWFRPTVPISSLTLEFSALVGFPNFQLWMASAGELSLAGVVTLDDGSGNSDPLVGARVELLRMDNEPVLDNGVPVTAVTGSGGGYQFDGLVPSDDYKVRATSDLVDGPASREVDLRNGTVIDADLILEAPPTPTTVTTTTTVAPTTTAPSPTSLPTPTTDPSPNPEPEPSAGSPELPTTGGASADLLALGLASLMVGTLLAVAAHRSRYPGRPTVR